MSQTIDERIQEFYARAELPGLHAVIVQHKGEQVAESYFNGYDENWGRPIGHRDFLRSSLHDIRSISKSITSLLYGIALRDGLVPSPDAAIIDHLAPYKSDHARWDEITVADTLSMQMGIRWNEDIPYSDPRNSEVAMEMSGDRIGYVLSQPVEKKPGTKWQYNGGATALIGKLITDGTKMPLDAYAKKMLFDPMGITGFEWSNGVDGTIAAASGLRMRAIDLLKIGQMIMDQGQYQGQQIVPARWIAVMTSAHASIPDGLRYGYFWWLGPEGRGWFAGFGNGGQRLFINPKVNLVMVLYAGNYNQPDAWRLATTM
ncbi:MAG: serine hydrolase, partial [Pseudomonadota bacterium]